MSQPPYPPPQGPSYPGPQPHGYGDQGRQDTTAWPAPQSQYGPPGQFPPAQQQLPGGKPWFRRKRVLIPGGVLAIALIGSAVGGGTDSTTASSASATTSASSQAPISSVVPPPSAADVASTSPVPVTTPAPVITTPAPPPAPSISVSQANALRSANQYLGFTNFSRSGLIEQLAYEGYSTEDATAAVDSMTVDWNEQAAGSAQSYLDFTSFSHSGLVDQLVYEGYTAEQAEYGVTAVGL